MKYFLFITSFVLISSCSKDQPINLTSVCEKGDMWMVNYSETFAGIDSLDSFKFVQGGGYHTFSWMQSTLNTFTLSVLQLPKSNEFIEYKKLFIKEFKCTFKGKEYTYDSKIDSVIKITNMGSHFILQVKNTKLEFLGDSGIDFRACDIKMTDITP